MIYINNRIFLSEKDGKLDDSKNVIKYDNKDYFLKPLNPDFKSSKGGNSSVFILVDSAQEEEDQIIKISNLYKPNIKTKRAIRLRYGRFIQEIEALQKLAAENAKNIVRINFDGTVNIGGNIHPYYVMEKGDTDLKEYFVKEPDVDIQEKVKFCYEIFQAIKQLHDKEYYHRDIKPDNIFLFSEDEEHQKYTWKIGDLGLIKTRSSDYDTIGEKIGPYGWVSPEAMNKFLTEKSNLGFDCIIDNKSDIFQMGLLFWFIFQQNAPIGIFQADDFKPECAHREDLYELIFNMVQYSKDRRYDLTTVDQHLDVLKQAFAI